MKVTDITVEVRDINFVRQGAAINYELEATPLFNDVGAWKLTLSTSDPLVAIMREPGSGIVVTDQNGVILSGPTVSPEESVGLDNRQGTITFNGVTDDVYLRDRLAYPQPSNANTATQNADYDTRSGAAESVMHAYVSANLGPAAPSGRRLTALSMLANGGGAGATIKKQARFDNLLELTSGIANAANISQRIIHDGATTLTYVTTPVVDRTASVRLDTDNNTLDGYRLSVSAPTATHAIVGAQDVTFDRVFATVTTEDSLASSSAWGRRIESFVNQSYTLDTDAFTQSAREMLAENGVTATNVQAIPSADSGSMRYGKDWNLGDKVTVVARDREYTSIITGLILKVGAEGVQLGLVLGEVEAFNQALAATRSVEKVAARVSTLERTVASTADSGWTAPTLTSSWANLGGAFTPAGFRLEGNRVELRGLVRNGTITGSIFTLPDGYRPPYTQVRAAVTASVQSAGASAGTAHNHLVNGIACRVDIAADGTITVQTTGASNSYISLDGISFYVD